MPETQVVPGTYSPVAPINQYRGTDPESGISYLYQIDANGIVVGRYDEVVEAWKDFKTYGPFARPTDLTAPITVGQAMAGLEEMRKDGLIRVASDYISIGDEPGGIYFSNAKTFSGEVSTQISTPSDADVEAISSGRKPGPYVANIRDQLGPENVESLKKLFTLMPRSFLKDWFDLNIAANLEVQTIGSPDGPLINGHTRTGYSLLWAAFIDLFNEANLVYTQEKGISPWDWEEEKMKVYLTSQNKTEMQKLKDKFVAYANQFSVRGQQLMSEYSLLPKLGDLGLEISRQYAISELLDRGEYDTVEAIIESYKIASRSNVNEALINPLPYDVTLGEQTFKA